MRWKQPGRQIPWGYHRIWLVEHHMASSEASAHPELLIAAAAAQTTGIRLGSGAVLMNHYSPFKVAAMFKQLEAMYPRRIDLGMGRATSGRPSTWPCAAIANHNRWTTMRSEEHTSELQSLMR